MWSGIKRVFLWDYPRASWQYDIIVGAILLFVLLTPRSWFHDQPRVPQSHQITPLSGGSVFWIEPELLNSIPASAPKEVRYARIGEILKKKTGRAHIVTRLDPVFDSEHELTGYMAVAKP